MFAKIFNQIFDSSIVDEPQTRFTFMDLLILADKNGVVDMTHESIARRTNRPIDVIRQTIEKLEGPDPKSRTPDEAGARIYRLDQHRDWGWGIVNYDYYRNLASQDQRREKTKLRVQRFRSKKSSRVKGAKSEAHSVTLRKEQALPSVTVTLGNDSPSASACTSSSLLLSSSSTIQELQSDPAFKDLNVQHEFDKALRWCKENHRQLTRRRFVNWLNRADKSFSQPKQPAPIYDKPTSTRIPTDEELATAQRIAKEETIKLRKLLSA
jgi:hypothetical protein